MKADRVVTGLMSLILIAFVAAAYRGEVQARRLEQVVRSQSPLTFQFATTSASGATTLVDVVCVRIEGQNVYACATEPRTPRAPTIVSGTPVAAPTPTPVTR